MAKGKKVVLRTDKKPEDTVEQKVASRKETKENKPASNKDSVGTVQSILQSLQSPRKPRSPLSDNSSMLIQEGNESDATNALSSQCKKDIPNDIKSERCESKEQKPETACHGHGIRKQSTDHLEPKESPMHTSAKSAVDNKVPDKPRSRTGRKLGAKKTESKAPQNRKVTDYYPIRRSNRKTKTELKSEEHGHIDDLIKNDIEEGMQIKTIEGKGRGIFASKIFKKGEFVVEYHGDLLELAEAKIRESHYIQDPLKGCYMYYFQYQSKTYCVDATEETSRLGRLINHSKTGNCQTRLHAIEGTPHLILVASRDIAAEEELLYDYGDRSKASVLAHPWLKY
ncbi:lysine methyltransferase 5Ab isoform X3 [Pseudoliparis swirei]|uniref:lysine methyltransferase 5Ab isoform X3 n=1 Tax=Pseudoliparis swirei TaxID=2059687 RepID=UPI0024BDD21F|nr:lysine methyltransferase 5Ab isoform X3 [Pseudoliparis swirei]